MEELQQLLQAVGEKLIAIAEKERITHADISAAGVVILQLSTALNTREEIRQRNSARKSGRHKRRKASK